MLYIDCSFGVLVKVVSKMFKNIEFKVEGDFPPRRGLHYRISKQKWDLHNQNL